MKLRLLPVNTIAVIAILRIYVILYNIHYIVIKAENQMSELKYRAGMVSKPFWFLELKKTVILMNSGLSLIDIKEKNSAENIYGANKDYRAKEIYNSVARRAKVYDNELISLFCITGLETQKAMALYAVMKTDRLFFEFMYEVYIEILWY